MCMYSANKELQTNYLKIENLITMQLPTVHYFCTVAKFGNK